MDGKKKDREKNVLLNYKRTKFDQKTMKEQEIMSLKQPLPLVYWAFHKCIRSIVY